MGPAAGPFVTECIHRRKRRSPTVCVAPDSGVRTHALRRPASPFASIALTLTHIGEQGNHSSSSLARCPPLQARQAGRRPTVRRQLAYHNEDVALSMANKMHLLAGGWLPFIEASENFAAHDGEGGLTCVPLGDIVPILVARAERVPLHTVP